VPPWRQRLSISIEISITVLSLTLLNVHAPECAPVPAAGAMRCTFRCSYGRECWTMRSMFSEFSEMVSWRVKMPLQGANAPRAAIIVRIRPVHPLRLIYMRLSS